MSTASTESTLLQGTLHIYVAFDWGDEILLDKVRQIVSASAQELPRRRRTPPSFFYRPTPLRVALPDAEIELAGIGKAQAAAGVTIFDFGAVSISLHIPFSADPATLLRLAGSLADTTLIIQKARALVEPLHR